MNFLELCQELRREVGISGSGPADVVGQSGQERKIVEWVKRAYNEIQTCRDDWAFLSSKFEAPLEKGAIEVNPVDFVNDFASFDKDEIYLRNQAGYYYMLRFMPFKAFNLIYLNRRLSSAGLPLCYSIDSADVLHLSCPVAENYTINPGYYKTPDVMKTALDRPNFPERFHSAILYKAMMYYAADEEAPNIYQDASANYRTHIMRLEAAFHRHDFDMPPPLA